MGPGRGRSRPERTRSAHPPSLGNARSAGDARSEGPSPPAPRVHAHSSRPSGEAPGPPAGERGLLRPDPCVCLSLSSPVLSLCFSLVSGSLTPFCPLWPSGGHRGRPGHGVDGLRHRLHRALHGRPGEQPAGLRGGFCSSARGEAAQRVRPPPPQPGGRQGPHSSCRPSLAPALAGADRRDASHIGAVLWRALGLPLCGRLTPP